VLIEFELFETNTLLTRHGFVEPLLSPHPDVNTSYKGIRRLREHQGT